MRCFYQPHLCSSFMGSCGARPNLPDKSYIAVFAYMIYPPVNCGLVDYGISESSSPASDVRDYLETHEYQSWFFVG